MIKDLSRLENRQVPESSWRPRWAAWIIVGIILLTLLSGGSFYSKLNAATEVEIHRVTQSRTASSRPEHNPQRDG
jgi:hypothetical protein